MLISLIFSAIQTVICLLMVLPFAIAVGAAVAIADDESEVYVLSWILVGLGIAAGKTKSNYFFYFNDLQLD